MSISRDEFLRGLESESFHVAGRNYGDVEVNDVSGTRTYKRSEGGLLVRGDLAAKFIYPDHTITKYLGRNIVVNSGLDNIARAIAAGYTNYTSYAINNFAIGDGTTGESAGVTSLVNLIHSASPTVSFANTGKVTFTLSLLDGDSGYPGAGSVTISEAGLRATGASPSLVTYKTFSAITKDTTFRLDFTWTLTFSYAG